METPTLLQRIRTHRLASTFTLLVTLTAGVLAGSVLTHDVGAKEQARLDTSDARPLVIPSPVTLSNGFSQIVKAVGPAVVNINTETIPTKSTMPRGRRSRAPAPPTTRRARAICRTSSTASSAARAARAAMATTAAASARRSAPASSSTRAATSSPTTTSSTRPTKIYVKLASDPDDGSRIQGRPATVVGVDTETDIAVIKIDTKSSAAHHQARQLRRRPGRRLGARHRQPLRPRPDRLRRHRLRQEPLHRRTATPTACAKPVPEVHPDRRRHQPRQLRRPAGRYGRQRRRHEHRHLYPVHGL